MVRLKTRYLVVEATGARKLSMKREDIAALIRESIEKSYGDYGRGLSQYAFQVLYYHEHTRLAVVRCARELCKVVESSLVFVTELQSQDLKIRVVRVCGSSRTCRQYLLSFSKERVKAQNLEAANPSLLAELQEEIAAVDAQ